MSKDGVCMICVSYGEIDTNTAPRQHTHNVDGFFDDYVKNGWSIMVNWLMSYDHWCVILGWFTEEEHPSEHIVLFYNHYYNDVRFVHAPDLG